MVNKWVEEWDKRIANWIERGPDYDLGLGHIRNAYKGKGDTELQFLAMPEPYVGDPLSTYIDAVMLTLNPGGSGPEQFHNAGCIVQEVKDSSYHKVASSYLHGNTKNWWEGRSRWPARLLEDRSSKCQVVGIDLIPWHSTKWGSIDFTSNPEVMPWFKQEVITPAATIAKNSKLSRHVNLGCPLVLAIGSHHAHCLGHLGFECLKEENGRTGVIGWPVRNGQPTKRNFRLFVSKDPCLAVLQTDASGTFKPPSENFDAVVHEILRLPL